MPVTQQYWRIYVNGATNGGSLVTIAEVTFLDTNNAAISLAGGTASALTNSGSAGSAFDGNPATSWASSAAPSSGSPQWLQYQFSGAVPVVVVTIQVSSNATVAANQSPPTFLIQSSPNGTTWTTQNTVTGFNWTSGGQIAYFTASSVVGSARVSQVALEVAEVPAAHVRVSQAAVEALINASPHVKTSQLAVEALMNASPRVKVSQMCLEVVYLVAPSPPPVTIQNFMLP